MTSDRSDHLENILRDLRDLQRETLAVLLRIEKRKREQMGKEAK